MPLARRSQGNSDRGSSVSDAKPRVHDLSKRFTPGQIVFAVLVFLVLGLVGWRITVDTLGSNEATTDPEKAVAWTPREPEALDELAIREVTKPGGDLGAAWGFAERALRSNPIDARALAILGLVAERQGNQARADILMRLANAHTRRDSTTQAWLVNRDIQLGEFDRALSHIDALLRVNLEVIEQTYPVLAAFMIDKRTFDILVEVLADAPPWRASFLQRLSTQSTDIGRLMQLYVVLKDSPHPPETRELVPYLDRLIRDGKFAEAYQGWRWTLSPPQMMTGTYPYNGNFAAPIDGLPFNWVLGNAQGVDIQIVAVPGDAGSHALQLQFSGTRVGVFTVGQLMLLPPGDYRLTGQLRAEELRTQRGLRWHIFCGTPPNGSLAVTELVTSSRPWTGFSVDFVVPAENCQAQWLKLEIPDRVASERQIEGQIWYENLQIARVAKLQQSGSQ